MRQFIITLFALFATSASFAQEDIDITAIASEESEVEAQSGWSTTTTRHNSVVTNSFFSNWFVSAGIAGSSFFGENEPEGTSGSPFKSFRNNLGLSIATGKWFTPGIGLRLKLNGLWGKGLIGEQAVEGSFKYLTLQVQTLFNFSNLFNGYTPTRLYNFIPYAGYGLMRNISYNDNTLGISFGLLNTFRLSDKVSLNLDLNYNKLASTNQPSPYILNHLYNLEFGITYNIGKSTWKKAPDVEAIHEMYQMEIDAINAQLHDEQQENEQLRQQLSPTEQQENE